MDGFEADHRLPEVRLWAAIVVTSLQEYEDWLRRIQDAWLLQGEPVAHEYLATVRRLRYEMEHPWFRHICDLANRDYSYIQSALGDMEKRYGFHNVRFAEMPPPIFKKDRKEYMRSRRRFRRNA